MSLTLSIDDHLAEDVQRIASTMGKSLEELVREVLEGLTAPNDPRRQSLGELYEDDNGRGSLESAARETFQEWIQKGWMTPPRDTSTQPPPRPAPVATMDEILRELDNDRADR